MKIKQESKGNASRRKRTVHNNKLSRKIESARPSLKLSRR